MRIAVPVANDLLCGHFGQCETFALFDVDTDAATIVGRQDLRPPPHEPGSFPRWLAERQTTMVIAGGMGSKARELFEANGIRLMLGAPEQPPQDLVASFLHGHLTQGVSPCDH